MYEPPYFGLTMEFYENMLESYLNPDIIISKVKGKPINMNPKLITELLGLLNFGIIQRERRHNEKPHPDYDREFGFPKVWNGKKSAP